MRDDVPWITLGSVPDDMRVKNHSWNKWCVVFMVGGCEPKMEPNTDMRKQESNERGEEKEEETGGATGGTYCQVGPRGVARVAPLSDSTHKREVGKTLAVCQKLGQGEIKVEGKEIRAYTADDILCFLTIY